MTWNMGSNSEKREKWKVHTCNLEYGKKAEKRGKWDTKLFNLEYGEKHLKTWTMRNEHCRAWIMARKLQIMENEKHTV